MCKTLKAGRNYRHGKEQYTEHTDFTEDTEKRFNHEGHEPISPYPLRSYPLKGTGGHDFATGCFARKNKARKLMCFPWCPA